MKKNLLIAIVFQLLTKAIFSQEECGFIVESDSGTLNSIIRTNYLIRKNLKPNKILLGNDSLVVPMPRLLYEIPVTINMVRQSNGSGGLLTGVIQNAIENLNQVYRIAGMHFFICRIRYFDTDNFYNFSYDSKNAEHKEIVNSFIRTNEIVNTSLNIVIVKDANVNFSMRPSGNWSVDMYHYVWITQASLTNRTTLPHEVGHYFGLLHTHGRKCDELTRELVDGRNCYEEGDFICDTPADPCLSERMDGTTCTYIGTLRDRNGDRYRPLTDNYMSYADPKSCRKSFTNEQYSVISHHYLVNRKPRYNTSCQTTNQIVTIWGDDSNDNKFYDIYKRSLSLITPFHKRVNGDYKGNQVNPSISSNSQRDYIIVWEDDADKNKSYQIFVSGFTGNGSPKFSDRTVNTRANGQQLKPDVAMSSNGNFVVVWEDDADRNGSFDIRARGFNATGSERIAEFRVNSNNDGQQRKPVIGMAANGDFIIAWEDDGDGNGAYQIRAKRFYADGREKSSEFTVNSESEGQQRNPCIDVANNGDFIVGWEDRVNPSSNYKYDIKCRGFKADGTERFHDIYVNSNRAGEQINASIAIARDGSFIVVWQDDNSRNGFYQILAKAYSAAGQVTHIDFTVNSESDGQQKNPHIAIAPDDNFCVVWEDDRNNNRYYNIYIKVFDKNLLPLNEQRVNSNYDGDQKTPKTIIW